MFRHKFQGVESIELLSAQGTSNLDQWRVQGNPKKIYDKSIKSYMYILAGNSFSTKITMPWDPRASLEITQKTIVVQLFVPQSAEFGLELKIADQSLTNHRVLMSSVTTSQQMQGPNAKVPLANLKPNCWLNLWIPMDAMVTRLWPSESYLHLVSVALGAVCRVRKIFTVRDQPILCGLSETALNLPSDQVPSQLEYNYLCLPKNCQFPSGVIYSDYAVFPEFIQSIEDHSLGCDEQGNINENTEPEIFDQVNSRYRSVVSAPSASERISVPAKPMNQQPNPKKGHPGQAIHDVRDSFNSLPGSSTGLRPSKSVSFSESAISIFNYNASPKRSISPSLLTSFKPNIVARTKSAHADVDRSSSKAVRKSRSDMSLKSSLKKSTSTFQALSSSMQRPLMQSSSTHRPLRRPVGHIRGTSAPAANRTLHKIENDKMQASRTGGPKQQIVINAAKPPFPKSISTATGNKSQPTSKYKNVGRNSAVATKSLHNNNVATSVNSIASSGAVNHKPTIQTNEATNIHNQIDEILKDRIADLMLQFPDETHIKKSQASDESDIEG